MQTPTLAGSLLAYASTQLPYLMTAEVVLANVTLPERFLPNKLNSTSTTE